MAGKTRLRQFIFASFFMSLGVILTWVFFVGRGFRVSLFDESPQALAAGGRAAEVANPAYSNPEAPADFYTCTPIEVAAYINRIHVRCSSPAPGGIAFFALGTNNANHTARVLTLLSMAHVTGRNIIIEYDPGDVSGTTINCLASDCRLILSVALQP